MALFLATTLRDISDCALVGWTQNLLEKFVEDQCWPLVMLYGLDKIFPAEKRLENKDKMDLFKKKKRFHTSTI